jgi:hypothetical protein
MDESDDQLDMTPGDPWYMKRFYVDGHEYDVVAIKTIAEADRMAGGWNNSKEERFEFKYITIRTQIPKVPVVIEQHSTRKQEYIPCAPDPAYNISVMPPFNYIHPGKRDIQEGWSDISWFGDVSDGDYKGETIKNKPPVEIHIEEETREPQFKGELKEKYNKRPLVDVQLDFYPPADGQTITGTVDGRGVSGATWVDQRGTVRWWLDDDDAFDDPNLYNGNDVSNFTGFFVETDYDNDGLDEWIMTIDWLPFGWGSTNDGPIPGWPMFNHWNLPEDYLCFWAMDDDPIEGNFVWTEDYEIWMTEQWHTLPDLYTEISINQDDDQLVMLTNDWYSDETVVVVPYYEDGAIREGEVISFNFFVPTFTTWDQLDVWFFHEYDDNIIQIQIIGPGGAPILGPGDFSQFTSKQSFTFPDPTLPFAPVPWGLWTVFITGATIEPAQEPESWEMYIEVRSTSVQRVKFWYDPGDCEDIYVNTAIITDGGAGGEDMCRKGDANQNCQIDVSDLDGFAQAFGTSSGQPAYNAVFDFDDSGSIGVADLDAFAQVFGQSYDDCTSCDAPPWQQWP